MSQNIHIVKRFIRTRAIAFLIATGVVGAAYAPLLHAQELPAQTTPAQTGMSVRDGVYSADQAKRGDGFYRKNCASCHGAMLEGRSQAPPLTGAEFTMNWDGQALGELFEKIQASMPADKPGSLSAAENIDILALLLRENRLPAGSGELPADPEHLKRIKFETAKGK